jgi:hypothetical protein
MPDGSAASHLFGLPGCPCRRPVAPLERCARDPLRDALVGLRVMPQLGGCQW